VSCRFQTCAFISFVALLTLSLPFVYAQETVNNASVSGRVTDPSGAVVQGAEVTARQIDTNLTNTVETDRDGRFRFPYLRVGSYEIGVHKDGFVDAVQSILLSIGAAYELPVSLSITSVGTKISVNADAPVLETARSQIAGTVSQSELSSLPLNGRNFLDLALVIPGVSPTNTASTQLFPETSAAPGQGISVSSQRNFSNNFIVDGLSSNDDAAGLTGTFYALDVVNQFQVVTSGGQAEFGRALGGYVNMVTKSGTNSLHGDLYGFFRNSNLNAANAITNARLPLTQAQYGASLGGPIIQDKTFYFANFERRNLNQSGLITIAPANVATINARLVATGYGGPQISTGLYPNPVHNSNFLGKVDHQFSSSDQFSVRYSLYNVDSQNSRGVGALSAVSAAAGLVNTDQTVAVSNVVTLSSRAVNETRGQFTHSNLDALPNDPLGPAVTISGVAAFGTLSGSPTRRENNLYEVVDNFSYQKGAHAIRVGADFLYNDVTITYPRSIRGSYSFSSLSNFQRGIYNNSGFTQTFGNTIVPQTNPNIGWYLQDEWKVNSRLTLNAGVRYDLQLLKTINTDSNNLSPRAGFAWTPFSSGRMVVRGSFGLFYDRIPLRALANALLSSSNTTALTPSSQVSVSLSPTQTGAPIFPSTLASLPAGVLFNYSTMDPNIQNAYSEQGSLEVEHQFGSKSTLSVSYQHLRARHLILSINRNAPGCTATGNNNGCRPDPGYGNNSQYSSLGDSQYDGLSVSFVQRPITWGSYRISYTYSKALNDVGEFFFSSPINNFDVWQDWGRSDDDQRHRVVFDATVHSPMSPGKTAWQRISHGFQLSGIFQYYSPLPFNVTTGATTVQATTARPIVNGDFIGRNTGIGFDSFTVNARASRTFVLSERVRMTTMVEAFNALNHRNDLMPNGTFGAGIFPSNPLPSFGHATAVADARTLQLGLRFSF
jgi:hypothetical protein